MRYDDLQAGNLLELTKPGATTLFASSIVSGLLPRLLERRRKWVEIEGSNAKRVWAHFNPLKPKLVYRIFKNPVRTSNRTPHFTITEIN
jgi:hypothetical protein